MPIPAAIWLPAVEQLLNRVLDMDPDIQPYLAPLANKSIQIDVVGSHLNITAQITATAIRLSATDSTTADLIIRGTAFDLLKLAQNRHPSALLQSSTITVHGDAALGQQLSRLYNAFEIDWEEQLAQRIGDIPAHLLGNSARGFSRWQKRTQQRLTIAIRDYLQEEIRHLPTAIEVENWLNDVDALREAAERLAANIELLLQQREQQRGGQL